MSDDNYVDPTTIDPLRDGVESWYMDEGIAGQGPRPDYLKSKYKTVADQAKAYNEIEKKLGGMTGAPESYDLEGISEHINLDNQHLKNFLNIAKDARLNQESVQKMMSTLVDYEKSFVPDENKEMERLGSDGQKRYQVLDQWAKNTLSAKAQETFSVIPKTAEIVEFMDELRQMQAKGRSQPPANFDHAQSFTPLTEEAVRNEMSANHSKYMNDANYRAEIQRKFAQVLGDA